MDELREINERLERIERILSRETKKVLSVREVMQLLGLKESALRHMMCERRIPYYRQGKRAWFNRKEIEAWQLRNRVATNEEIDSAAATHCALHKIGITI